MKDISETHACYKKRYKDLDWAEEKSDSKKGRNDKQIQQLACMIIMHINALSGTADKKNAITLNAFSRERTATIRRKCVCWYAFAYLEIEWLVKSNLHSQDLSGRRGEKCHIVSFYPANYLIHAISKRESRNVVILCGSATMTFVRAGSAAAAITRHTDSSLRKILCIER